MVKAKAAEEPEEGVQERGQRVLRTALRSFGKTWKLYRGSLTGMVGLGIVAGFFFMATFADYISPYDTDFTAPAQDIFIADHATADLVGHLNWTTPMGLTEASRESTLKRVLVSSDEGTTLIYPVDAGLSPTTGEPGLLIYDPEVRQLPKNVSYLNYAHFTTSFFFVLDGSVLHEYYYNSLIDSNVEYDLNFEPTFVSNLWNGYSIVLTQARLAIAFADEHEVFLVSKRPPTVIDVQTKTYVSNVTIHDATIISNPLVIDGSFDNGSMIIIPTDRGIMAYRINVTKGALTGFVSDVRIGERMWLSNYSVDGEAFEPVVSDSMITFPYPSGVTDEFGKTKVIVGTTDGRIVSYYRVNGTVEWANPLVMSTIRDYEITGVFPSPTMVLVTGKAGDRGFIAGVDPATGVIRYNNTQYTSFEGHLNSAPQYVFGQKTYVLSTDADRIYLLSQLLKVNATFGAPGGGATPVAFLGNIYTSSIIGGNYFGIVTNDNTLFAETLSGVNVAPLPPGTYPSGNRYLLGTDYEGHDILSWMIYGTRAELMVGVTAAFFAVVIGTIVGLVAGFYSGLVDDLLMRATDVVLSLPGLVIILLFAAVFGPSLTNIIIIIAILSWAGIARVIRSVTLSLKKRAFVDAAIIAGASESRLIFKHIAPNVLPYTFLYMTFTISGAIVTEAILAFLGFGDVNYVTWGMMLQYLQISGHTLDATWWLLPPGIAITLLSLAFYLIGRAFDEVVNPRLRKR